MLFAILCNKLAFVQALRLATTYISFVSVSYHIQEAFQLYDPIEKGSVISVCVAEHHPIKHYYVKVMVTIMLCGELKT